LVYLSEIAVKVYERQDRQTVDKEFNSVAIKLTQMLQQKNTEVLLQNVDLIKRYATPKTTVA